MTTVIKRDGTTAPYDGYEIARSIEEASAGLPDQVARATQLQSELEITLFDGITSEQLDEAVIGVALQNVKDDPAFDAHRCTRIEVFGNALEHALDQLEASGTRYESDGDPATIARPIGIAKVSLGRAAH